MDDDANECTPDGHQWVLDGVHLASFGGAMWVRCRFCGAVEHRPAENYRAHLLGE